MDLKFEVTASAKSDTELLDTIENRQKYLPETIEASVAELQYRKHAFTDEELNVITEDVEAHRRNAAVSNPGSGFFNKNYKRNIIEDPDAPAFYSRLVIYAFAFLFSTLFGSILLAININKTDKPARMIWVVLFGVAFTAFQILVGETMHSGSSPSVILSFVGAYMLESLFWNRYIGNATFYRTRPIWIPLIIGLILLGLIILSIIYAPAEKG
jgi:hypothetical protein